MYFLRGSLPWQGLQVSKKDEKYEKIKEKKMSTSIEALCKGYPEEFKTYLTYCRELKFDEKPDYAHLKNLFLARLKPALGSFEFDWVVAQRE